VVDRGAGEILLTSMDRDGTKAGYDIALTRAVADAVRAPVIASGGVGTLDHMVAGIRDGHATAVLAASIFHFGTYTVAAKPRRYMAESRPADAARLRGGKSCGGGFSLADLERIVAARRGIARGFLDGQARRRHEEGGARSSARRRSRR
jgi:hypothetical protein